MFLRFSLLRSHPDTGVEEGIFGAAHDLRDKGLLPQADQRRVLAQIHCH
jgi:hypothetical protein